MVKYTALDPNVEVIGRAMLAATDAVGKVAEEILTRHHIYPLDPEKWYKQQDWLNAISELEEGNFLNHVAVGMKVPDNATWPPQVKTVHDALASINIAYGMNHRGGEIGGYHYTKTDERSGIMICDNPYPGDFDYGIIYRTVQKFRSTDPDSKQMVVRVDEEKPTRKDGGKSTTYIIEW